MKNFKFNLKLIIVVTFTFIVLTSEISKAHAQVKSNADFLDPKTKAFLVICGYGVVGGGLLGLASMAFGQTSRAIAQGASLGLYAGIIFGAYVIYTHNQELTQPEGNYEQNTPYDDPYVPFQDSSTFNSNGNLNSYWQGASLDKLNAMDWKSKQMPTVSWTWTF